MSSAAAANANAATSLSNWLDNLALAGVLLVSWEMASLLLGRQVLPGPWATLLKLLSIMSDADFPQDLRATSVAFAWGFVIACVGGVGLGFLLGANRLAGDVMEPMLMAFYAVPKIALYPVVLLMFGLGLYAKVAFGVIHGIVPIAIFTMGAVRNMPLVYGRTARAYRLAPLAYARHVLLPAAAPEVVAGLRIGFSLTLLGTLIVEMFASQNGIGHMLMSAMSRNDTEVITALATLLFVVAIAANMALLKWHRRLTGGG